MTETLRRPRDADKSEPIGHIQEVSVWLGMSRNPSHAAR